MRFPDGLKTWPVAVWSVMTLLSLWGAGVFFFGDLPIIPELGILWMIAVVATVVGLAVIIRTELRGVEG